MSLPVPRLDDLDFEELVSQAQALIPRFASDWTDHNVHDPGITFIELFAWLAEMQIYSLDQVTEASRRKFLKLLGLAPRGLQPARVEIDFDLERADRDLELDKGTRIEPIGREAVVFETERVFYLTRGRLERATSIVGSQRIDQTKANKKDDVHFFPFGDDPRPGAVLELSFKPAEEDPGPTIAEKRFHLTFASFEAGLPPRGKQGEKPAKVTLSAKLEWEYQQGSKWRRITVVEDGTESLTRSGRVLFETPQNGQELSLRCRLAAGSYEIPPRLLDVRLNTIPVVQVETVADEDLETGTGRPGQTVTLKKSPVFIPEEPKPEESKPKESKPKEPKPEESKPKEPKPKEPKPKEPKPDIQVREKVDKPRDKVEFKWRTWKKVESFEKSGPADRHYLLDPETGRITFGNGLNGRVPQSSESLRACYRHSLGAAGNLPAGQGWKIHRNDAWRITGVNRRPAAGGLDAETLDDAEVRARADFHQRRRAVTTADYEELARSTPGLRVARAEAIADRRPDLPGVRVPGSVTVVVVPHTLEVTARPTASDDFLDTVKRHLDAHRLITADIHVVRPSYVEVSVAARIFLRPKSDPAAVEKRVLRALRRFLDPVRGGPEGKGWPFGRSVYASEIYQLIERQQGVDYLVDVTLKADGRGETSELTLPADGLAVSGNHRLQWPGRRAADGSSGKEGCPC